MFYLKYIRYYFIFLTFLAVLTPVSSSILEFIPALIFLWCIYIVFSRPLKRKDKLANFNYSNVDTTLVNNKRLIILIIISALIFFPLYSKFYTGRSLIESFQVFKSGDMTGMDSNYYLYQEHFKESGLNEFSLKKLPYIIIKGVFKFIFWIFAIKIIGFTRKITPLEIISLITFFALYFLFGAARGTSFENFELLFILLYSVLLRFQLLYSSSWIKGKMKIFIYSFVVLAGFYFMYSKSLRYEGDISFIAGDTTSMAFNSNHFVAQNFPLLTILTLSFSGYFLFGLYAISNALSSTLLNGSLKGFIASVLPYGLQITGYGETYRTFLCRKIINCGASWIPESLEIMSSTGLLLFFVFVFFIGKIAYNAFSRTMQGSIWHAVLLYIIVLLMFSLPVGNFLTATSANIIAILLLALLYYKPLRNKVITEKFRTINQ